MPEAGGNRPGREGQQEVPYQVAELFRLSDPTIALGRGMAPGVPQRPVDLGDPERRRPAGTHLCAAGNEPVQNIQLVQEAEPELPVLRSAPPVHVQKGRVAVVPEPEAIVKRTEVLVQLEVDDRTAQQLEARKLPVPEVPGGVEELQVLALRCESPFEPVHRVADLIVPDRSGKGGKDAAQGVLELLRFLDELAVLEDDDQDLVSREVPDERDVFLQTADVAKRQADGQATDVQRLDEVGNLGRRERPLVLERSLQVDAKADSMVVAKCFEPSVARQPFEEERRPGKGDEPFPQLVPDSEPTEPSLGAPVEGRRLIGEVIPAKRRPVKLHVEART